MGETPQGSLAKIRVLANKLGASFERDDDCYVISAPAGKMWASDPGTHSMVLLWRARDLSAWKISAAKDVLDRASMGLTPCAEDCDCGA